MEINKNNIKQVIEKVKAHKKYSSISDTFVKKVIENYYKRYGGHRYSEREFVKHIRARLHKIYSSYQTRKKGKHSDYLQELKESPNSKENKEIIDKILSSMISTKERLPIYPLLYKRIFKITGKPKTIVDLGAGINPVSIPYMNLPSLIYYAYDIDLKDTKFLNKFFKIQNIEGKAKIMDVRELNNLKKLPQSDVVFMFKIIPIINPISKKKKKIHEEIMIYLLKNKTKFIVISFPTKTFMGKMMTQQKQKGFELMLERNNLKFTKIKTSNEIFYVVARKN